MRNYDQLFHQIIKEVKAYQKEKDYTKFKKIDIHEHVGQKADFEEFLKAMDRFNIRKAFLMPTGKNYQEKEEIALKIQKKYPKRFIAFANVDKLGKTAEKHLVKRIKQGAKGLKLLLWHANIYPKHGTDFNSKPAFRLFKICEQNRLPILVHLGLGRFPQLNKQLEEALATFTKTTFLVAHYLKMAPRLEVVAQFLDKYPNLYTDISMGGGKNRYVSYIQGFRKKFRNFFREYSDRITWGVDTFIYKKKPYNIRFYNKRIKHDLNLLEERFFYSPFYEENRYLFGLNLPDWILRKIYWENPLRIFKPIL